MSFRFEKDLVEVTLRSDQFWENIRAFNYHSKFEVEVGGLFGIPDLVVLQENNEGYIRSIAFEMKLSNWKKALMQAFRYRSFAERSFVILDQSRISPAIKNLQDFKKSKIGLISINCEGSVEIHYFPDKEIPYSISMHRKLNSLHPDFKEVSINKKELI